MTEQHVGTVTHYWGHLGVAGVHMDSGTLRVGDKIHILGHTSDFEQVVGSIQIEHEQIQEAHSGENIGIKVVEHAREHDQVFKVVD